LTFPGGGDGRERVLFLCVHNSARSLMAEVLLRHHAGDRFEAFSAGTEATRVNPLTVRALEEAGLSTEGLRSKPMSDFVGQQFDYVITVCDPARQACPVFPGARAMLHWDHEDPSAAEGTDEERLAVFRRVRRAIEGDVRRFAGQPSSVTS
jgi:arsenate reductase (thioredoxin)